MKLTLIIISFFVVVLAVVLIAIFTCKSKKLNRNAEIVRELLPGLNCGKCGRKSCSRSIRLPMGLCGVQDLGFHFGNGLEAFG